jgi:hypothetical protein
MIWKKRFRLKIWLPYDLKKKFYGYINSQLQHKDNKMIGHKSFADRNK